MMIFYTFCSPISCVHDSHFASKHRTNILAGTYARPTRGRREARKWNERNKKKKKRCIAFALCASHWRQSNGFSISILSILFYFWVFGYTRMHRPVRPAGIHLPRHHTYTVNTGSGIGYDFRIFYIVSLICDGLAAGTGRHPKKIWFKRDGMHSRWLLFGFGRSAVRQERIERLTKS